MELGDLGLDVGELVHGLCQVLELLGVRERGKRLGKLGGRDRQTSPDGHERLDRLVQPAELSAEHVGLKT